MALPGVISPLNLFQWSYGVPTLVCPPQTRPGNRLQKGTGARQLGGGDINLSWRCVALAQRGKLREKW